MNYQAVESNSLDIEGVPEKRNTIESKVRLKWTYIIISVSFLLSAAIIYFLFPLSAKIPVSTFQENKHFDFAGRYIIRDFDTMRPVSNFLSGLAGVWGVPMWAFYVNRGQGITSFGIQSKDGAISKFYSAEKAYQLTPFTGFRTFIKGNREGKIWDHAPFDQIVNENQAENIERNMHVGMNEMEIVEEESALGLRTNILYFTLPDQSFPGLVRRVTISNTEKKSALYVDVFDGLARLLPGGLGNNEVDLMGRTREAWMNVYNVIEDANGSSTVDSTHPFFHISQGTEDTAVVQKISDGHFVISFLEAADAIANGAAVSQYEALPIIVDPALLFGRDTTLSRPRGFFGKNNEDAFNRIINAPQVTTSRTPCSFAGFRATLPPSSNITVTSIYGHAASLKQFVREISPLVRRLGFVSDNRRRAVAIAKDISKFVSTETSMPIFDAHVSQTFLDNTLRGGLPVLFKSSYGLSKSSASSGGGGGMEALAMGRMPMFVDSAAETWSKTVTKHEGGTTTSNIEGAKKKKKLVDGESGGAEAVEDYVFHVYSRIHGDIERDYNNFNLDPSYFSQGPGNFRDVSQNRRLDVLLQPAVKDFNLRVFLSLLQADGYNPLTVATSLFKVPANALPVLLGQLSPLLSAIANYNSAAPAEVQITLTSLTSLIGRILAKPFRPGQLFSDLLKAGVVVPEESRNQFLETIVASSVQSPAALYAQNGYWSDHWTYTFDHLESYLTIYPDDERELLFHTRLPFFFSPGVVRPRARRHTLVKSSFGSSPVSSTGESDAGKETYVVRAYNAVAIPGDADYPAARADAVAAISKDVNIVKDFVTGAGGIWQRDMDGDVVRVSVLSKLIFLGMIKFSTLDPAGMGVEMEGGKPGWNDAMNGLPGLMGSGMPETYEFLRILQYARGALERYRGHNVTFPTEISNFLIDIREVLESEGNNSTSAEVVTEELLTREVVSDGNDQGFEVSPEEYRVWDGMNTAREKYREAIESSFEGSAVAWSAEELLPLITLAIERTEIGIAKALTLNLGLSPTYFYYSAAQYSVPVVKNVPPSSPIAGPSTSPSTSTFVKVLSFRGYSLPLFLEGPVRHLKIIDGLSRPDVPLPILTAEVGKGEGPIRSAFEEKLDVYRGTKNSALYDSALRMYTVCESLGGMSEELGRVKAFSPGWLENQSIWLHMSYKFYLELLKGGLYDAFFTEAQTGFVPFMSPDIYGRSPLEFSSFLPSSAFPDPDLRGSSFLARLSGSTAEFLSIWFIMMAGHRPFRVENDNSTLQLVLQPILPSWLFDVNNRVSFTFLGSINVTYINPRRLNTWEISPADDHSVTVLVEYLTGAISSFGSIVLDESVALAARRQRLKSIAVYYI